MNGNGTTTTKSRRLGDNHWVPLMDHYSRWHHLTSGKDPFHPNQMMDTPSIWAGRLCLVAPEGPLGDIRVVTLIASKDRQVYVSIHKSDLYRIACRYPAFPCTDMIHWIVSHTDPETMTLRSVSGTEIATFREQDYQQMYHLSKPVITMETPFSIPNNNANSSNILKNWVKELAKFRMTPNQI